ncbi:MAG: hypothetical protein IJP22_03985 [Clostridia bacterium]|nr:hypothetical protein [Clostridia bacterium]
MNNGFVKISAATPVIKVADVDFNTQSIIKCIDEAEKLGVKVLALPELCVTGYTCGDPFLHKTLLDAAEKALEVLKAAGEEPYIIGSVIEGDGGVIIE